MINIQKTEEIKDIKTLLVETHILTIEFGKYIKVLVQNKNEFHKYADTIPYLGLALNLKEIDKMICELYKEN
jgi:hypothetical protein